MHLVLLLLVIDYIVWLSCICFPVCVSKGCGYHESECRQSIRTRSETLWAWQPCRSGGIYCMIIGFWWHLLYVVYY